MWFFILYRARYVALLTQSCALHKLTYCYRQDGPALIGLRHPWDGHGHGDEHH